MKVVILTGAGASYAVNAELYPTTKEFVASLREPITSNKLYRLIVDVIRQQGDETIDVEKVLWRLQELKGVLAPIVNQGDTANLVFKGNRIGSSIGGDSTQMFGNSPHFLAAVEDLMDTLNQRVYELYSHEPSEKDLDRTWIPLLANMVKDSWSIGLFTTNYDLVIQSAIEYSKSKIPRLDIHLGYTSGAQRSLDIKHWSSSGSQEDRLNGRRILVTKLHGSVDWSLHNNKIIVGGAFYKGSHERHAIIYPGYKGIPNSEPFQSFHLRLKHAIQEASHVIAIGFAFRDQAINDLFNESAQTLKSLVVIDPGEVTLPIGVAKKKIKHIKQGFGSDAVHDAFKHLSLV